MAKSPLTRKHLQFSSLDEAVRYAEQLHRDGYRSLGNWNLAQICEHLSDWLGYMVDGYPRVPMPVGLLLWGVRKTAGRVILRKILSTGKMAAGGPTTQQTIHAADGLEDETSLRRFRETVERFQAHQGNYHVSPIFGSLSSEAGLKLHLVHCAHHLSFLAPADSTT